MRSLWKWIVGGLVVVAAALVVGPYVYIHFIEDDAPDELQLTDSTTAVTDATPAPETSASTTPAASGIDGTWTVGTGSTAGYRAKEVLFGQDAEAAGRTEDVTGSVEISGTTVKSGSFVVDMTTVTSDQSNRDNAYRGRIMEVDQFPTSTFELTQPIELGSIPDDGVAVHPQATGDLTIHGITKTVTIDLDAQMLDGKIEIVGHPPIKWSDYDIADPSGGPATVTDNGKMEFKLVLSR